MSQAAPLRPTPDRPPPSGYSDVVGVEGLAGGHLLVLVGQADGVVARAAARLLERAASGMLPGLAPVLRAAALVAEAQGGRARKPAPARPEDIVLAGLDAWGAAAVRGHSGPLVVYMLAEVRVDGDLPPLRASVERVAAQFVQERLPAQLIALAVCLRPPDRLDTAPLRDLPALALPPVLVNLCPAGGPLPPALHAEALAELLELLITAGPERLLGRYRVAAQGPRAGLLVALDGIEVPLDGEARYLTLRLVHHWLDALLPECPTPWAPAGDRSPVPDAGRGWLARLTGRTPLRSATTPDTPAPDAEIAATAAELTSTAEQDLKAIQAGLRSRRSALRWARRQVDRLVAPRLLRRYRPAGQHAMVAEALARTTAPGSGLRDQLRDRIADLFADTQALEGAAERAVHRLLGSYRGGIEMAEEALLRARTELGRRIAERTDPLVGDTGTPEEPPLVFDATELHAVAPRPLAAPWRTLVPWVLVLAAAAAYAAASQPPLPDPPGWLSPFGAQAGTAARALLYAGVAVAGVVLWQGVQWLRWTRAHARAAALPRTRLRARLEAWLHWFARAELPRWLDTVLADRHREVAALRERLSQLRAHYAAAAAAERARLESPAFPRRLLRPDLDAAERDLAARYDPQWLREALRRERHLDDSPEAVGRALCELWQPATALAVQPAAGEPWLEGVARRAVAERLAADPHATWDGRLEAPAVVLAQLVARAVPGGTVQRGTWLFADPDSRLAGAARAQGYAVVDRLDHARATLVTVDALHL
jgi:hypothetical protein